MTDFQFWSYMILWAIGSLWAKWLYKKTQHLDEDGFKPGTMHLICCGCLPFIVLPFLLFFTGVFFYKHLNHK